MKSHGSANLIGYYCSGCSILSIMSENSQPSGKELNFDNLN